MNRHQAIRSAYLIVVLGAVIHFLHMEMELALRKVRPTPVAAIVPTPEAVKLVSLGFDQLLADFYWLAFVQYIGDTEARKNDRCCLTYKYLDLITSLDPRFIQAYWFAAFSIGQDEGNPQLASNLIERGIKANQDNWYVPFIAGINQYLYAHNEIAAARYYRMAAKYPHAPSWLNRQASILEAKIPSIIKEVRVWNDIHESAKETLVRNHARDRLISLWMRIYKVSPSLPIRKTAIDALKKLGVRV